MIFVSTGTQIYGFDRLIKQLDALIEAGAIQERVVAQLGHGKYLPKHMEYKAFMDKAEYDGFVAAADLIISHGGTGALIGALKAGKQVIAVPRRKEFNEHIDDHQKQVTGMLSEMGYLRQVTDMDALADAIRLARQQPITKKYDRPSRILPLIEEALGNWFAEAEGKSL